MALASHDEPGKSGKKSLPASCLQDEDGILPRVTHRPRNSEVETQAPNPGYSPSDIFFLTFPCASKNRRRRAASHSGAVMGAAEGTLPFLKPKANLPRTLSKLLDLA